MTFSQKDGVVYTQAVISYDVEEYKNRVNQQNTTAINEYFIQLYIEQRTTNLFYRGFTIEQIIDAVAHHGGYNNLEAISSHCTALQKRGFSREQIVQMSSHKKGFNNLEAVKKYSDALRTIGVSNEKIVSMVSRFEGWKAIKCVAENAAKIKESGISINDFTIETAKERASFIHALDRATFKKIKPKIPEGERQWVFFAAAPPPRNLPPEVKARAPGFFYEG